MNREQIADKLLDGCPEESRLDHEKLAELIRGQVPWDTILDRPEADRWPETYRWLKDNRPVDCPRCRVSRSGDVCPECGTVLR